jgi:integrase
MTTTFDTNRDTKSRKSKRDERLSPDGKWLSFRKVPNLLQYVSTGLYFARLKVNGKLIRRSLKANTFEEAKLALHDFVGRETKKRHVAGAPVTFAEARGLYETTLANDATMSGQSKVYRQNCIKRLLKSWPGLDAAKLRAINQRQAEEWASKLAGEVDAQYFNNILGTFKAILKRGGIGDDQYNPLFEAKRMGIRQAPPKLPEPDQFLRIIETMETSGAGRQQECADFARFLAFSGCRLSEARQATWADVNLEKGVLTVHNAKVRRARNYVETREVPIIPDMRALLERTRPTTAKPEDSISTIGECEKSLVRACKIVGAARLTHHDLRHLFATRCIEAGVEIPTVSRWLGHSDGGALAMRVYGHLRDKHSVSMAQRVTFSQVTPANVLPMPKEAVA